jgi:NitT/TauT family transport system ATP-binding protein
MRRLWNETNLTVVMVTHDLTEAFRLGTRILALERRRNRPEEKARYGATIAKDIEIWPLRIAGAKKTFTAPAGTTPPTTELNRDGPDLMRRDHDPDRKAESRD